jgi:hypothetical protein
VLALSQVGGDVAVSDEGQGEATAGAGESGFRGGAGMVFQTKGGDFMKERHHEIDTNINILHAMLRPGQRLSFSEIAEIVGCSKSLIQFHQESALRKLREKLRRKLKMDYGEFAHTKVRVTR